MTWHNIHGHDDVVEQFRRAIGRGRLASSFLFVGPAGIGKRTFALKLAQALLCPTRSDETLDPCGQCKSCVQVAAGTHPDVDVVCKPKDRAVIPLELLIGDKEHRGSEGLCHRLSLKPYMGGRKVAVIDDADHFNAEGANCLLKTLEEPPPRSVLILIGTSPAKQLPTIRSRCQLIRFRPLPEETVAALLVSQNLVDDADEARRLARHADGSIQQALALADPELWTFRNQLFERLSDTVLDSVRFSKTVLAFVDEAGKQPAARRARLRQVVAFATDFYRSLLHAQVGTESSGNGPSGNGPSGDEAAGRLLDTALRTAPPDPETTAARLDRCLEAARQIDRNANQTTLIETWLDDLTRTTSPAG